MNQKFELGQIVATTTLFNYCKEKRFLLLPYLLRHANCDWGSICEEDKKDNIFHSTGAAGNDTTRGAETDSFPELPCGQCTSE